MSVTEDLEITHYVAAVRAALADLPQRQRDDLLEDLPGHLAEVRAESGEPLARRLGPPEVYAAELRAAVGLTGGGRIPLRARLDDAAHRLRTRRSGLDRWTGSLLGYEKGSDFLALLRPGWWVLRGYLAVMIIAAVIGADPGRMGLIPRVGDSLLVALFLLVAFVLGSIWLGRREDALRRNPRRVLRFATLVLALWSVVLLGQIDSRSVTPPIGEVYTTNYGPGANWQDIQDVYVYDSEGRLITDVRLFDQNGRPIELGWNRCTEPPTTDAPPTDESTLEPYQENLYPYCPNLAPFVWDAPSAAPTPSPSAS